MHGRGRAEKELILFRGGWTRAYSPTYIYVYENVRIRVFAWKARLIRFSTFISRDNKDSWPQSVILYREIVHLEFSFKRVLIPYPRFSPLYNPFFFFFFKYFNPSRSSRVLSECLKNGRDFFHSFQRNIVVGSSVASRNGVSLLRSFSSRE